MEAPKPSVTWREDGTDRTAGWRSVNGLNPPGTVILAETGLGPAAAVRHASQGRALLWRGKLDTARRLLSGMRKHWDRKPLSPGTDPAADFYRHRQHRRNRARVLGLLLIALDEPLLSGLSADTGLRSAVSAAYGEPSLPCLVSVRELLGVMSAHQWQREGVWVAALGNRIHPRYGVFAPTRDEYVDLVAAAPLSSGATAFDIGTGTGVLAALLAQRGASRVTATDNSPAAVACARDNLRALGLADRVEVLDADLFPPGRADVVLCNPPWLPGTPHSALDAAVFDHGGRMLSGFLAGLTAHLEPGGEGRLVMSDLAERVGLRRPGELAEGFATAGLRVLGRTEVSPRHPGSRASRDPLAQARRDERVSLWRLAPAD